MNEYLQDEREIKGYVEIEYSDIDNSIVENAIYTYPTSSNISSENFIDIEKDNRVPNNYASLENNYFLLDGSFVLPYKPENEETYYNEKSGYITNEILSNCTIQETLDNEDVSSKGITIYIHNNIPENIEITIETNPLYKYYLTEDVYAVSGKTYYIASLTEHGYVYEEYETYEGEYVLQRLYEKNMEKESETLNYELTDNSKDIISIDFETDIVLKKITYNFSNFEYDDRRFRISYIDYGLSDILRDDTLINFNVIENIGELNLEFPSNQLVVNLYDDEDKFNLLNPKGYAKQLNENVKVKPYIGIITKNNGIIYNDDLGIYFLDNWTSNKNEITLNCVDYINRMKNTISRTRIGNSIYEFDLSNINTFLSEQVGAKFDNFTNFYNSNDYYSDIYVDTTNVFDYVVQFMIWVWGLLYCNNNIELKPRELTTNYNELLTLDNSLINEPTYSLKEPIKNIIIKQYSATVTDEKSSIMEAEQLYITNTREAHNNPNNIINLDGYHLIRVITNNVEDDFISDNIVPSRYLPVHWENGYQMTFYNMGNVILSTNDYIKNINDKGKEISIDNKFFKSYTDNTVMTLDEKCELICDKIINENKKYNVSINYTGDPNIKPNMIVPIETQYGNKQVKVLKHTLTFNGGLTGSIEGVGD